jgi:hypothetical protein
MGRLAIGKRQVPSGRLIAFTGLSVPNWKGACLEDAANCRGRTADVATLDPGISAATPTAAPIPAINFRRESLFLFMARLCLSFVLAIVV